MTTYIIPTISPYLLPVNPAMGGHHVLHPAPSHQQVPWSGGWSIPPLKIISTEHCGVLISSISTVYHHKFSQNRIYIYIMAMLNNARLTYNGQYKDSEWDG